MTRSTKKHSRPSRFYLERSTDGCDETYDVVSVATGKVIASLPFWEQDAETLRDAHQFIAALEVFYRRGGYFFVPAFLRANRAIFQEIHQCVTRVSIGGDDAEP